MLCPNESHVEEFNALKKIISEKINYHRLNAYNSLKWHNFLGMLSVGLNALQVLTLGILTSARSDEVPIVIVSSSFVFLSVVVGRIQNSYNFNVLNILHNQVADDLEALNGNFFEIKHGYLAIMERSHIQEACACV